MEYHIEIVNGKEVALLSHEHKVDWRCPVCGGEIITNFGPGIEISWCTECGYTDEDYDF